MTTIELTKIQRKILERGTRHPKGRCYVQAWRQGSKCGGHREHAALKKLVEMSLMADYRTSHNSGYAGSEWNHPVEIYSTEAVAFITEAGREAIR